MFLNKHNVPVILNLHWDYKRATSSKCYLHQRFTVCINIHNTVCILYNCKMIKNMNSEDISSKNTKAITIYQSRTISL